MSFPLIKAEMDRENSTLAEALPSLSTFPCLALNNTGQKRELENDTQDVEEIESKKQKQDHSAKASMQTENINIPFLDRNMFDDALVGQGYEAPADFDEDSSRDRVLQEIIDNAPPEDRLQVKADVDTFVKASRALGRAYAKPVDGGTWKVRGMNVSLLSHQVTGAGRGRLIENNGDGVLLTDQMGLGKTITVLAVITATRLPPSERIRATLIVVQPNNYEQWRDEIKKRCLRVDPSKPGAGVGRTVFWRGKDAHENFMDALHALQEADVVLTTTSELKDSLKENSLRKGYLHQARYYRIVLDEAHDIRSRETVLFEAVFAIDAIYHWAVTGTPMVNRAADLFALLVFTRNALGKSLKEFEEALSEGDAVDLLESTLQDCIVGRTYATKFFNTRLVELPPMVRAEVLFAPTGLEKIIIDLVQANFAPEAKEKMISSKGGAKQARGQGLLNRPRQIVSHPVMLEDPMCELLLKNDVDLNPDSYEDENHKTLSRLLGKAVKRFSAKKRKEIKAAKTTASKASTSPKCVECNRLADEPQVITPCGHIYCEQCLADECGRYESVNLPHPCRKCSEVIDGHEDYVEDESCEANDKAGKANSTAGKGSIKDWKERGKIYRTAKIICLVDTIRAILAEKPDEKVILFMQYHQLGDVLAQVCKEEKWGHVRYNGSQTLKSKSKAINDFKDEKKRKSIFIASMNAGGVGLNLTVASVVILVEHWWNSAMEQQAFARIYRIGQQKQTRLLTMVGKETVEEGRMVQTKVKKNGEITKVVQSLALQDCFEAFSAGAKEGFS